MLANGAEGDSRSRIYGILGYGEYGLDDVNNFNNKLLTNWLLKENNVIYKVTSSIWADPDVEVNNDYVSLLTDRYLTDVNSIEPETFIYDVNTWCKRGTDGRISKFFINGSEVPQAAIYNATYFKGKLYAPFKFDANGSFEGTFTNSDQSISAVTYMTRKGNAFYHEDKHLQSCRLRFGDCYYDIVFILPKENVSMAQAIEHLSGLAAGELWNCLKPETGAEVNLSVPRLNITTELTMDNFLADMGVSGIDSDDFHGIANGKLDLSDVRHKTVFALNEDVAYPNESFIPDTGLPQIITEKATLTFDRPFLYMVYNPLRLTPVIIGQVNSFAE